MVSTVIVAYRSGAHLQRCLDSLCKPSDQPGEVIVIDNASTDDSIGLVRQHFPQIRLIINTENRGFAAAGNLGFRSSKGLAILFLNPDTVADEGTVKHMFDVLNRDPKIAAVGCQILNPNGSTQPTAGSFPTVTNLITNRTPVLNRFLPSYCHGRRSYYLRPQTPDWISGACLLVRRQAFKAVGGFDEKYFMYGEDVDLCYRLRQAGWRIAYTPSAHIVHADEGKTTAKKMGKFINLRRGLLRFYHKHYSPAALARLKIALRIELGLRLLTTVEPGKRQVYHQLLNELTRSP